MIFAFTSKYKYSGLTLSQQNLSSVICTASPRAGGFAAITGVGILKLPAEKWKQACLAAVRDLKSALVVLDSFPLGFRGEDLQPLATLCPVAYLARLRQKCPAKRAGQPWQIFLRVSFTFKSCINYP